MSLGFIFRRFFFTRLVFLKNQYHLGLQDIQWPASFYICSLLETVSPCDNARPTVEPWRKTVLHRFDETHARWVPIILPPLQEASDENVGAMATAQGIGWFTIPSLAEFGQLSLQPNMSGSAEPAAVATETPVEVVAMTTDPPEDPLPPLPESPVIEDDPILIDDDHTIPALADMVE